LKVEGRGSEVFQGHTVADSSFDALVSLEAIIKAISDDAGALVIEIELVGDAMVLPENPPSRVSGPDRESKGTP
jgi:hypothetical protein